MFIKQYTKKQLTKITVLLVLFFVSLSIYNVALFVGVRSNVKKENLASIQQRLNSMSSVEPTVVENYISVDNVKLSKRLKYKNEQHYIKVEILRNFFRKYKAPLYNNAEDFVSAAEKYGIDYRLAPSISIVESTGGKNLFRRYNPFGWGKKDYPSFKAAIYDVSRGLSNYYKGGAVTPRQISWRYNPDTPNEWSRKVTYLMNSMPAIK